MITADMMQSMRGGPAYEAAWVQPATARAWVAESGLELGSRDQTIHPRYDLADVGRLVVMQRLTATLGMQARSAAAIVNRGGACIQRLASEELKRQDDPGHHFNDEQRILVCTRAAPPNAASVEILSVEEYASRSNTGTELVLDLAILVREARDNLVAVLER